MAWVSEGVVPVAVAVLAATLPSPAGAQTAFLARQKLVVDANAAPRYTPVYSSTYGNCIRGSQSAPITGCRDSSGAAIGVSECSMHPVSTSRSCEMNCTTHEPAQPSGPVTKISEQVSRTAAATACREVAFEQGRGVCFWNGTGASFKGGYQTFDRNGLYHSAGGTGVTSSAAFTTGMVTTLCRNP